MSYKVLKRLICFFLLAEWINTFLIFLLPLVALTAAAPVVCVPVLI